MIALMKRILAVSGRYQRGGSKLAFVFSFLKSHAGQGPHYAGIPGAEPFSPGNHDGRRLWLVRWAWWVCVLLQVLFQHIADRLQAAAGFLVFADLRMELGAHLRRLPMGYFTEGQHRQNQLRSVHRHGVHRGELYARHGGHDELYLAQAILVLCFAFFNLWMGLAAWWRWCCSLPGGHEAGEHLQATRMPTGAERERSHGRCWTCGRASASQRPSTCWGETFRGSSRTICTGAASHHSSLRRTRLPWMRLYLVCGLGSAAIAALALAHGRGRLIHHLPAGCPALRL